MRALVVYESVFGDARTIAHAIAEGLSAALPADVVAAAQAPTEIGPDVGLLVVGGPNHAFGMPRPSTREGAVKQYGADIADTGTGLHEWLEALPGAHRYRRGRVRHPRQWPSDVDQDGSRVSDRGEAAGQARRSHPRAGRALLGHGHEGAAGRGRGGAR